jgi:hypothetical protein
MTDEIKSVPTTWRGVTYRSRTEARWAVFLAELPIAADYEAEPFRLQNGLYLPDFRIPEWKMFIEVKGREPTEDEAKKCSELARLAGEGVLLTDGAPSERFYRYFGASADGPYECWARIEQCRRCPGFVLEMAHDRRGSDWAGRYFIGPHAERCTDRGGIGVPQAAIRKAADERFGVHPK